MRRFRVLTCLWVAALVACVPAAARAQEKKGAEDPLVKAPQGCTVIVVVKDAATMDAKIAALLTQFLPPQMGIPPDGPKVVREVVGDLVGDVSRLRPGSPLIFAMKVNEADIEKEPDMAVLLDVADFKALVGEDKPDEEGVYTVNGEACSPYNGMLMFGEGRDSLLKMRKLPAGVALVAEQREMWDGSDVFALVDLKGLMKALGPKYEESHAEAMAELKEAQAAEAAKEGIDSLKAKVDMLESLWGYGRQLEWTAGGGTIGQAGVDIKAAVAVTPGSKLAGYFSGHPALGAKLDPALPAVEGNWAAFWFSADSKKISDALADMFGLLKGVMGMAAGETGQAGMVGPGPNPAQFAKMCDRFADVMRKNPDLIPPRGAGLAVQTPGGGIARGLVAYKVGDHESYLKTTEKWIDMQKQMGGEWFGAMAGGAGAGLKMATTLERDVEKVGDLTVDRMTTKFTFPPKDPNQFGPDVGTMLRMMYGGDTLTMWMAHSGQYMLGQLGPRPDRLATMAKTLAEGGGLAQTPEIAALAKYTLSDANAVGYVSLANYVHFIMQAMMVGMGGGQGMPIPPMPPEAVKTKSALSFAAGKNRLAMRVYVPVDEMKLIMSNFMMLQAVMMQQMQPPMPPPENGNGGGPPIM